LVIGNVPLDFETGMFGLHPILVVILRSLSYSSFSTVPIRL